MTPSARAFDKMAGQMRPQPRSLAELTRTFFRSYPDFPFCRTLALNVQSGTIGYAQALDLLSARIRADDENCREIEKRVRQRTVVNRGQMVRLSDLGLRECMALEDEALEQVLKFYLKHPYAHGRTRRLKILPRWIRTFYLSVLVGHARRRRLQIDFDAYYEFLRLL